MRTKKDDEFIFKTIFVCVIAIVMLIPLWLVKNIISEREELQESAMQDIKSSWASSQSMSGPYLQFDKVEPDSVGKQKIKINFLTLYPEKLYYNVTTHTETLHRSIYDVPVYTSDLVIKGEYKLPNNLDNITMTKLYLTMSDLRGIVGNVDFRLGDKVYLFTADNGKNGAESIVSTVCIDQEMAGDILPFEIKMQLRGTEYMLFYPSGSMTEVQMRGDCLSPSFIGNFLPNERQVNDDGFTAHWIISPLNHGNSEDNQFGVKMLQSVTQYQQTTRAAKYGILIVALVFLAGFLVEMITKREISLLQYIVIGLSLVLFYMLLLSFSEFMTFWLSYLLASLMTIIALTTYFRSILKSKIAYCIGGFVALSYVASYILMQMETFAMLAGTLLLFVCLCAVMYFTSNTHIFFRSEPLGSSSNTPTTMP